jgi:hypothetical protein
MQQHPWLGPSKTLAGTGGDPDQVFISGHSAGGYLTSMVGLDKAYLGKHGIGADRIAGLIPFSGHTITHFTPREERWISKKSGGGRRICTDLSPSQGSPAYLDHYERPGTRNVGQA